MLAYVFDEQLKEELNNNKENYWDVYIREINEQLGLQALTLSCSKLENKENLDKVRTLIVGRQSGANLSTQAKENLSDWVQKGGMLIGFALEGLDDLFGIKINSVVKEADAFSITGYFEWQPHWLAKDIHPLLFLEQRRVIASDILEAKTVNSETETVAKLCGNDGKTVDMSVITFRKAGKGIACWFAFDVAKTIWILHQGRPVWKYKEDGNQPRTCELQILGQNLRKVFYADEILFVLQNMIAQNGQLFIYQIPPDGDKIPEALFYWGGDEYRGPAEYSINASDWMKEKGLPFHINIESEHHPMTKEQAEHIWNNGHELSVYYTLDVPDGTGGYKLGDGIMSEELFTKQNDKFLERFGYRPITSVNH